MTTEADPRTFYCDPRWWGPEGPDSYGPLYVVGCGETFIDEPDEEGNVDCPFCGMWMQTNDEGGEITVTLPKQSLATAAKVLASIDGGECYKPRDMSREDIHVAAHDLEAAASELESCHDH